jgi:hypothetical protein
VAITTSSGERYDSLENFVGGTPNEYVKMEFDTLFGQTKPDKSKQPVGPIDAPTQHGDWESEMITDFPPLDYNQPKDTWKDYKQRIDKKLDWERRLDKVFIKPQGEKGRVIIPGEEDYIRTKDLGKEVKYD